MENAKLNVRVTFTLVLGNSFQEFQRSEVISAIQNSFIVFLFFKRKSIVTIAKGWLLTFKILVYFQFVKILRGQ